jgi:hypothetical protein
MNPVQQKLLESTSLPQDAFYVDDQGRFFTLQMQLNDFLGNTPTPETELLWINAPQAIDLNRRRDLALLLLRYASGARNWKVSTALNQYAIIQDLDKGTARAQLLAEQGEERSARPPPSGSGRPPDPNTAQATATALRRIYLRELAKLPWQPTRLALTVVAYDALSNTVPVALAQDERAAPAPLATVHPSAFVSCPAATAPVRAGTDELTGSLSGETSQSPTLQGQLTARSDTVSLARSSALLDRPDIVRATLLAVSLDRPPQVVDLAIPVAVQGGSGGSPTVSAIFCIDLAKALGARPTDVTLQVYLLAGLQAVGPLRLTGAAGSSAPGR